MIKGNWLIKIYECTGDYCYFGERLCSSIPWHMLIVLPLFWIMFVFTIKIWRRLYQMIIKGERCFTFE
jgi:hypothetical protein